MKLETFVGYGLHGMASAVADAHNEYNFWLKSNHATAIGDQPIVTATIRPADGESGAEYWFTITIVYKESQQ